MKTIEPCKKQSLELSSNAFKRWLLALPASFSCGPSPGHYATIEEFWALIYTGWTNLDSEYEVQIIVAPSRCVFCGALSTIRRVLGNLEGLIKVYNIL